MKKYVLIVCMVLFSNVAFAASAAVKALPALRESESYVDTGNEASIEITLSGTPGTLTTVTLPDNAKGFRLYPRSNHVRFATYLTGGTRTLAAVATDSDGTVAADDLAIGGIAKADMWETRLLPTDGTGTDRVLTLRSITGSVVIDLEVF